VIEDDTFRLEPALLNVLIGQIATLSSVYHKPPEAFVVRGPRVAAEEFEEEDEEEYEDEHDLGDGGADLLDMGGLTVSDAASPQSGGDVFSGGAVGALSSVCNCMGIRFVALILRLLSLRRRNQD
jgi:AP-1 complex subunit beta-1